GLHAALAACLRRVDGVLGEDDRIVVGERHAQRAGRDRRVGDRSGRGVFGQPVVHAGLGDVPVLAEAAAEVAAGSAEREDARTGIEMIERLLLDRVEAETGRATVRGEHHLPTDVLPHEAERPLAIAELAVARAQIALDPPVRQRMPVAPWYHARIHRLQGYPLAWPVLALFGMPPRLRILRFPDPETRAAQIALFLGLYDTFRAILDGPPPGRVKLLNPCCHDDDPVSRRFALLEID